MIIKNKIRWLLNTDLEEMSAFLRLTFIDFFLNFSLPMEIRNPKKMEHQIEVEKDSCHWR